MALKAKVLHHIKKLQGHKYSIQSSIPFVLTFANALCGLFAILFALEGNIGIAGLLILFAVMADSLDGRIARAFGSDSFLGAELDALSDVISFGLAPVILAYQMYNVQINSLASLFLMVFLCSALFRLARFNVTPYADLNFFKGLPVPAAASILASIAVHYSWFEQNVWHIFLNLSSLNVLLFIVSLLMVSSIPFPSGKGIRFSMKLLYVICIVDLLFFVLWQFFDLPVLFIFSIAYILSGIVFYFFRYSIRLIASKD